MVFYFACNIFMFFELEGAICMVVDCDILIDPLQVAEVVKAGDETFEPQGYAQAGLLCAEIGLLPVPDMLGDVPHNKVIPANLGL